MQPTMSADEYAALRFAIARGYCQDDERASQAANAKAAKA